MVKKNVATAIYNFGSNLIPIKKKQENKFLERRAVFFNQQRDVFEMNIFEKGL